MDSITSVNNKEVRRLGLLQAKARERRQSRSFVIEGERIVKDTPAENIMGIYVTEDALPFARETFPDARITQVSQEVFARISDTRTPQGILAEVRMPLYTEEDLFPGDGRAPLLLMAQDVQDPGNLGTMIRTAEAAGVTGVVLSRGCVDLFNPKTVRATMSAIFRVPFVETEDFDGMLRGLRERGVKTYAAYLGEKNDDYDRCSYVGPSAFLIGNEGNGLKKETADLADAKILIPMQGEIESLNAAVSAAILMYEAARQRRRL